MTMRYILAILFTLFSTHIWAQDLPVEGLRLATPEINQTDMASIQRGAKLFATNCMSCHTLSYLRFDKVAADAGIKPEGTPANLKFNGVSPPDLSLETDVRGVDWVYTYLHSFYVDSKRPSGANNLLVPGTAMPGYVMGNLQGEQQLVENPMHDLLGQVEWYDLLKLTKQGSLAPDQFDQAAGDLTNFLAYAAEPFHADQQRIGWWVLGFLVIMFILMYMLKKEYWKDVKKHQ